MKKYITIAVLFVYLFSATEFSELLKVPDLFRHYTEHRSENHTISFLDYLVMHYGDAHASKDNNDHSLPFKSHTHCAGITQQSNIVPNDLFSLKPLVQMVSMIYSDAEAPASTSFSSSIWQPPKFA